MQGMIANLGAVHLFIWGVAACLGLLLGMIVGRRDVTMGNITLIFGVLSWSMFIGLLPIINNAIKPDGLAGLFSGRGFARFLEDAAPQAIFAEPMSHRIEVLVAAVIGAVIFSGSGLMLAVFTKGRNDG